MCSAAAAVDCGPGSCVRSSLAVAGCSAADRRSPDLVWSMERDFAAAGSGPVPDWTARRPVGSSWPTPTGLRVSTAGRCSVVVAAVAAAAD